MSDAITLVLPYPPTVNNLFFTVISKGRPIRVPTSEAKKYRAAVEKMCKQLDVQPFVGDVVAVVSVYRPKRIGDLDNTFKAIFDAVKGYCFADDKQIKRIEAERFEDPKNPRVELQVRALGLL